jgi:hypothetical protein
MVVRMNVELDDIKCVTETAVTIRKTRRRTTVPKVIVDHLELDNGDKLRWCLFNDDTIIITKVK